MPFNAMAGTNFEADLNKSHQFKNSCNAVCSITSVHHGGELGCTIHPVDQHCITSCLHLA